MKIANFKYWPHIISVTIIGVAFIVYRYSAYYSTYTNDAYVSAHIVNVAAIVSGPISHIYIKDNQTVKKGDKLVEIDPRPYLYAMEKAKAALKIAEVKYENAKLTIEVAEERYKQAQAMLTLTQNYLSRYQKLQKEGALPEIKLLDVQAKIQEQMAMLSAAAQELKIARESYDINEVLAAKAIYQHARYLFEHTTIYAAEDGYVTNFNIRRGQYIKAGQGLFALVETKHWWVVSRYRETAIRLIKPGDKAKITLYMYPGKVFEGHVESVGWGINRIQSGRVAPSTLVYMEETEDWIKIAQRFPVRIAFDEVSEQFPLRIGASATTTTYR